MIGAQGSLEASRCKLQRIKTASSQCSHRNISSKHLIVATTLVSEMPSGHRVD